jgi:tetratricopeptide (TPR) repeat protein
MLTYIVNTLFKTDKLKQSLQWAERLRTAMDEYNQLLYDKYFFFYYNALVINYSVLDPAKAITILEDLKEQARIKANDYYLWFVYLNLAVLHFDQGQFKEAIRHFTKLSVLDGFKSADASLRLKITIGELLNRYELQQSDVIEYKMARVKKEYKELLSDESHYGEKEILDILRRMLNAPDYRKDQKLVEKMAVFVDWTRKNSQGDGMIIDYGNWINAKLDKRG